MAPTILIFCAFFICSTASAEEKQTAENVVEIDASDFFPIVPVYFWDRWHSFVLDTGAGGTLLDWAFTNHLSYASNFVFQTPHGVSGALPCFKGIPIYVGGNWSYPETLMGLDMTPLEELSGATIDGILGENVLEEYVVIFDFKAKTVSFQTNLPMPMQIGLPFKRGTNGYRAFPARLGNGEEVQLGVDTGFAGGEIMLNPDDWARAFPKGPEKIRPLTSADMEGKLARSEQARLPLLKIGAESYTNLVCDRLVNTNMPSQVGLSFLQDHRVTIDYPDDRVSLVRVRNTAASHGSMTGLGVKWIRGSAIVIYVGPNSAAREAGIQEGDDITRINGKTVWEYKRSEIYDLMEGNEGDVVELVILRGDQAPITARMRLKPEI
jgi:hypothetical protein